MTPEPAPTPTQVPKVRSLGFLEGSDLELLLSFWLLQIGEILSEILSKILEIWRVVLQNICEFIKVDSFGEVDSWLDTFHLKIIGGFLSWVMQV